MVLFVIAYTRFEKGSLRCCCELDDFRHQVRQLNFGGATS